MGKNYRKLIPTNDTMWKRLRNSRRTFFQKQNKQKMECYYWKMLLLDCTTAKTPYTLRRKKNQYIFMCKYNSAIKIFYFLFIFYSFYYGKQLFTENIFNVVTIGLQTNSFKVFFLFLFSYTTHIYVYQLWLSNNYCLWLCVNDSIIIYYTDDL